MNQLVRFRFEMFIREKQFYIDNREDFPVRTVAAEQFDVITAVIAEIEQLDADKLTSYGEARFGYNNKKLAREALHDEVTEISEIAPSMAYEIPGIDIKFRVPRNLSDANLLAIARTFYSESEQYETAFVRFKLDDDFREKLLAALDNFAESLAAPISATDAQVTATAALGDAVRRGMIAHRILKGVVRQIYRRHPAKLAAWLSASHLEKAPLRKKTDEVIGHK